MAALAHAIDRLEHAAPQIQRRTLSAAAELAAADGILTVEEAELLRMLGDVFQQPVPALAVRHSTAAQRFRTGRHSAV